MQALLSVHDVMPHTMPQICDILHRIRFVPSDKISLLIVPGLDWDYKQLVQLHQWQEDGYDLAGHGWHHHTTNISTVRHKLHSRFISRDVAEHLSLPTEEVEGLILKNYWWWEEHGFVPPTLYVPPAWAMGKISQRQVANLPFRFFESSQGIFDKEADKLFRLPVLGFEADTIVRELFLRPWNWLNFNVLTSNRPARISLHPYDFEYRAGDSIKPILRQVLDWLSPSDLAKKKESADLSHDI